MGGRFTEGRNNRNEIPAPVNERMCGEQRERLREKEISKEKGDKQDMEEERKESRKEICMN